MGINRSCPFLFWTLGFRHSAEVRAASCGKHTAKSTAPAILLTKIQLLGEGGCRRQAARFKRRFRKLYRGVLGAVARRGHVEVPGPSESRPETVADIHP